MSLNVVYLIPDIGMQLYNLALVASIDLNILAYSIIF